MQAADGGSGDSGVLIPAPSIGDAAGWGCGIGENERGREEARVRGLRHWEGGAGLPRSGG